MPRSESVTPNVPSIEEARIERLVCEHLPLARRLAHRYRGRGEPFDDLVQVANVGLLVAARRYDESRGIAFGGYATAMIVGELRRHFRDRCWALHVPRGAKERALLVRGAVRDGLERTGVQPSQSQLVKRLQLSEREVLDALDALTAFSPVSLDAPVGRQPASEPLEQLVGSSDCGYDEVDVRLTLAAALRTLPVLERRILCLRYLGELTQCEIATRVGISQMQVSRVLRRIADKLEFGVHGRRTARPGSHRAVTAGEDERAA